MPNGHVYSLSVAPFSTFCFCTPIIKNILKNAQWVCLFFVTLSLAPFSTFCFCNPLLPLFYVIEGHTRCLCSSPKCNLNISIITITMPRSQYYRYQYFGQQRRLQYNNILKYCYYKQHSRFPVHGAFKFDINTLLGTIKPH